MDSTPVSLYEDIINNIVSSYYNIREIDDEIIKFHNINFIKNFLFNFNDKKIGMCLIQEFDKINYNCVNYDVRGYKFHEKDRIIVSQFANKINSVLNLKKF
jgi:hypothetical protein